MSWTMRLSPLLAGMAMLAPPTALAGGNNYKNFDVAIYSRVYETQQMKDPAWLESRWEAASKYVKIDKVYLETHRDLVVVDQETLDRAKKFFASKGVRTSGGITATVNERNQFETFCYSNPEHRKKLREVVEFTARNFDELILDDFFFTSCKEDVEIQAKGSRSWTEYRLALMDEAARELIIKPARAVNPKIRIIIKYPNWYDHFQNLGFNLASGPKIFDKIYTGTETRDPVNSNQHLQQYHGYSIVRYFENLKPGGNAGGWVDMGGMNIPGRFEEQLWLTLFAKAPEITIFNIGTMYTPSKNERGEIVHDSRMGRAAGPVFEKVDSFLDQLGRPIGVDTYKPFHSYGEDHLPSYLGMLGIPMNIVPEFPAASRVVLLTEQARFDPQIVAKMKKHLSEGKNVVITSGLLKALQGKGIEDIVELEYTGRTVAVREFMAGRGMAAPRIEPDILLPEIRYFTNDSWEIVSAFTSPTKTSGTPVLLSAKYSKGVFYVLTIPNALGDLYSYPPEVLRPIRQVLAGHMFVRLDAPSRVSIFVYDNDTFIVESFRDEPVQARILADKRITRLRDLLSGEQLSGTTEGTNTVFTIPLVRASYRVFKAQ